MTTTSSEPGPFRYFAAVARLVLVGALTLLVACTGAAEITASSPASESAQTVVDNVVEDSPALTLLEPVLEPSCSTVGSVIDLEVVGNIVIFAGDFEAVVDVAGMRHEQAGLAACTIDGQFLDAFTNPTTGAVRVVVKNGDELLIGGTFTLTDQPGENFASIDPATGMVNADFGPKALTGSVHGISVAPSKNIYITGAFNRVESVNRTSVVRLRPDGELDEAFFPRLGRTDDEDKARIVYTAVEFGDRVYLGGDFGSVNDVATPGIGAVDVETGRINAVFAPDLADTNPADSRVQIRRVAATDDWIYLCGDWWSTENRGDKEQQRNFGRFSRTGVADPNLEPWTDGGIRDCEVVADRYVALAGHFDMVSANAYRKLALVSLADGEIIRMLDADSPKGVQTLDVVDGLAFIGGTFNRIAGDDQQGLAVIRVAEPAAN